MSKIVDIDCNKFNLVFEFQTIKLRERFVIHFSNSGEQRMAEALDVGDGISVCFDYARTFPECGATQGQQANPVIVCKEIE